MDSWFENLAPAMLNGIEELLDKTEDQNNKTNDESNQIDDNISLDSKGKANHDQVR